MASQRSFFGCAGLAAFVLIALPSCLPKEQVDPGSTPPPAVFVSSTPTPVPEPAAPAPPPQRIPQAPPRAFVPARKPQESAQAKKEREWQEHLQREAQNAQQQAELDYLRGRASYNAAAIRGRLPAEYQPRVQDEGQEDRVVWVADKGGNIYHAPGCRYLHGSGQAVRLSGLLEHGYRACARCGG